MSKKPGSLSSVFAKKGEAVPAPSAAGRAAVVEPAAGPSAAPSVSASAVSTAAPAQGEPTLQASPPNTPSTPSTATETARSTTPVRGGAVLRAVPLSEIDENPFNARRIYRMERVKELAVSLAQPRGQIVPGIATDRGGRVVLVAGHYRLRALRHAGISTMLLMVYPDLTDREMYELSLRENDERDDQSTLDNAYAWKDLLDKKVYASEADLSESIGKSPSHINKTLAVLKLSSTVLEIIRLDPAKAALNSLYELHLLSKVAPNLEVVENTARDVVSGTIGQRAVQELRDKYESGRTRSPKQTSRHYKIEAGGQSIGVIKDFDDGRVQFQIKIDEPSKREELVEFLKARFEIP